jgi:hypothetical protein
LVGFNLFLRKEFEMVILQIISSILLGVLLMNMLAKTRPLMAARLPGKSHTVIPLSLIAKIWLHRSSLLALLTGSVFGVLAGWLPLNIAEMVGIFALVILLMPMQFTITSQGVGVGRASFYPWSDFSGFKVKKSSIDLSHPSQFGRLTLFVKPAEMNNVLKYIEHHIKVSTLNA